MENIDMQLIIQIAIAIGIVIIFRVLSSFVSKIIIKILSAKNKEKADVKRNPFYRPLKTIFTFIGVFIALNFLKETIAISVELQAIINKALKIAMIIFVAKAFGEGLDDKNGLFTKIKTKSNKEIDPGTRGVILKAIRIIIYVIAAFMVISELGYNISGFITSLGIGGVVITLAAQDTAKSLIGGALIILDKPFKVGDYIKVGQFEGTVEEITFRSTNIRTLDNSVLHIPNSEISISAIINFSEMEKRRYFSRLTLELNTKLENVENVKNHIQQMLENREDIIKDSVTVKFENISSNGMDLLVIGYINVTDYSKFLEIKEQINYAIMAILQNQGVELAYNTQTVYVKK